MLTCQTKKHTDLILACWHWHCEYFRMLMLANLAQSVTVHCYTLDSLVPADEEDFFSQETETSLK